MPLSFYLTFNIKQKMLLYRINFTKLNMFFKFNWKQYPVLCLFSLSILFSFPLSLSVSELLFSVLLSKRVSLCFLFPSCFFPLFATNCFPHILTILFQNISHSCDVPSLHELHITTKGQFTQTTFDIFRWKLKSEEIQQKAFFGKKCNYNFLNLDLLKLFWTIIAVGSDLV